MMIKKLFLLSAVALTLNGCSTFFDKDNTPAPTPLVTFKPEARVQSLWSTRPGNGDASDAVRLVPAIANNTLFTVSSNGVVAANDLQTGKSRWTTRIDAEISGGATTGGGLVFAGTRNGELYALDQQKGAILWKAAAGSEILAPAAANSTVVLAKATDGSVTALSVADGHRLWKYQQTEPTLVLRGASAPQLFHDSAIIGFEDGDLLKLGLREGHVEWQQAIAEPTGIFAIQRMIDIDADPVVYGNRLYAATYQGKIAALNPGTGSILWSHDISSYTGMVVDGNRVYISDAKSHVLAFNATTGEILWEQGKLEARSITGPALINDYLVVGDAEGYLHWMSRQDGHFVARTRVTKSGINAAPIVMNSILYVATKDGHLAAYTIR